MTADAQLRQIRARIRQGWCQIWRAERRAEGEPPEPCGALDPEASAWSVTGAIHLVVVAQHLHRQVARMILRSAGIAPGCRVKSCSCSMDLLRRWNDCASRRQSDVLDVLDRAIGDL